MAACSHQPDALGAAPAAGALAGPAMLLTGTQQAHTSLALYVLIRGLTLLIRCGNLPQAHPFKVGAAALAGG